MVYGLSGNYNALNGLSSGSLGLITSGTNNYGTYGYAPIFGGGLYSDAAVDNTKRQIQNGYEVNTYNQAYSNKQSVESMDFTRQSQTIQYLLQQGRTDEALAQYEDMVENIASMGQYADYTDSQLKTIAQTQYQNATGSTLVKDVKDNASGSFTTGLKNGTLFGLLSDSTKSENTLMAQVTGTPESIGSTLSECLGAATGAAATVGGGAAAFTLGKNLINKYGKTSAATKASGVLTKITKAVGGKKLGIAALAAAGIAVVATGIKSLLSTQDAKA